MTSIVAMELSQLASNGIHTSGYGLDLILGIEMEIGIVRNTPLLYGMVAGYNAVLSTLFSTDVLFKP